jgi:hypothetical protein
VIRGPAGTTLVSIACRPGDVLVVGTGRRTVLHGLSACSVSRYCAAHARCPVVLVPPPELAGEIRRRSLFWEFAYRTITADRILRDNNDRAAGKARPSPVAVRCESSWPGARNQARNGAARAL